ncbi:hypothetical protein [Streptomyces sp. NPDC002851]
MTVMHEAIGHRRHALVVPAPEESVQRPEFPRPEFHRPAFHRVESNPGAGSGTQSTGLPQEPLAETPIYCALLQQWAGKGRTLPGHRDPEWSRLAVPMVQRGQFGSTIPFSAVRRPD